MSTGESPFDVPGYDVGGLLGAGATAEVWHGVERASADAVALKRARAGVDPAPLHREAEVLAAVASPYVVRLRAVVGDVLVLDLAAGGSLAALLERRGALAPAEVVTVAAPLASALAVVHAAGLVHGDVSPGNVLFTADGMPLLGDLGGAHPPGGAPVLRATAEYVDPVVAGGGPPGAASDVWALGAVCHHLLTGAPPFAGETVDEVLSGAVAGRRAPLGLLAPGATRALVTVVEAALSLDPQHRPTAAALASALLQAQAAEPVRLQGPRTSAEVPPLRPTHLVPDLSPPPAAADPGVGRRRRRPSAAVLGGAVLVAGLLALGLTWALSGADPAAGLPVLRIPPAAASLAPPSASSPAPSGVPVPAWREVLTALDATREQAFATADAGLLDRVYTAGSPPLLADRATLAALAAAGRTAEGVRHELRVVDGSAMDGDRAELVVTDLLGAQTVRDAAGTVVQQVPGRPAGRHRVVLERRDGSWLIAQLAAP